MVKYIQYRIDNTVDTIIAKLQDYYRFKNGSFITKADILDISAKKFDISKLEETLYKNVEINGIKESPDGKILKVNINEYTENAIKTINDRLKEIFKNKNNNRNDALYELLKPEYIEKVMHSDKIFINNLYYLEGNFYINGKLINDIEDLKDEINKLN